MSTRKYTPPLIAFDVSTNTGVCFNSKVAWTTVALGQDAEEPNYQVRLYHAVMSLVASSRPLLAIVEDYAFSARGRSVTLLAELGGTVKLALNLCNVPTVTVTSNQWKAYVLGKGSLKKEDVKVLLLKKYGIDFSAKSQDEADAYCLWRLGQLCLQPTVPPSFVNNKPFRELRQKFVDAWKTR